MKFLVTYCVTDREVGSNPLWHTCLILSYWPGEGKKIEVTNIWGYYAERSTNPPGLVRTIKTAIGFDIDLLDNHGTLKKEEMRYFDLGRGLHGKTFEITFEQFLKLKSICKDTIRNQKLAIEEAKERLKGRIENPTSHDIFHEELCWAKSQGIKPRLEVFDFKPSIDAENGITFDTSHNCKTKAIDLLRSIGIDEREIKPLIDEPTVYNVLTFSKPSKAIPRRSGKLEPIYLHSTGSQRIHVSERTGKKTLYRTWEDKGTKLSWSLPPQIFIPLVKDAENPFYINDKYVARLRKYVRKLQQLEKIVENAEVAPAYEVYRAKLAAHLAALYQPLASVSSRPDEVFDVAIQTIARSLNDLYFAMVDRWEVLEEVETIASEFPIEIQEAMCKVLDKKLEFPKADIMGQIAEEGIGPRLSLTY